MVINYQDITLRDMKESDIADHIRWRTVETAWKDWDGPWVPLSFDDPEGFRQKKLEQIRTLDKKRLREHMGKVDDQVMRRVDSAIAVSFGLSPERLV